MDLPTIESKAEVVGKKEVCAAEALNPYSFRDIKIRVIALQSKV